MITPSYGIEYICGRRFRRVTGTSPGRTYTYGEIVACNGNVEGVITIGYDAESTAATHIIEGSKDKKQKPDNHWFKKKIDKRERWQK